MRRSGIRCSCFFIAAMVLFALSAGAPPVVPPLWDESIDGDLSDSASSPTAAGTLDDRSVHIAGSADSTDHDYFLATVPAGGEVTGFTADVTNDMPDAGYLSCVRVSDSMEVFNGPLSDGILSYLFTEPVVPGDFTCHLWETYAGVFNYYITFTGTGLPIELQSFSVE